MTKNFLLACLGLFLTPQVFGENPSFKVQGRILEAQEQVLLHCGEAPSAYEDARWIFKSEQRATMATSAMPRGGKFELEVPLDVHMPWLVVEVGTFHFEAKLGTPLRDQVLAPLRIPTPRKLVAILTADGKPVEGALVWIETVESPLPEPWRPSLRKTITSSTGSFEIDLFPGERAILNVSSAGFLPGRWEVLDTNSTHFELTRGTLKGILRVFAEVGKPAEDILVTLGDGRPLGFTDRDGKLAYSVDATARLVLRAAKGMAWQVEPVEGQVESFLGGKVLVRGKLENAEAEAITPATLEARSILGIFPKVMAHSMKDGSWALGPLLRADWEITIRAQGFADRVETLSKDTLDACAAELDFGQIQMAGEAVWSGIVIGPRGPVAGAEIYLLRGRSMDDRRLGMDSSGLAPVSSSDGSGTFVLGGLEAGEQVRLEVRAKGFTPYLSRQIKVEPDSDLEIELVEASTLTVHVGVNELRPVDSATVSVEIEDKEASSFLPFGQRRTDQAGVAILNDLPRGKVRIRAEAEYLTPAEEVLELLASQETLNLRLGMGATVEGQLKDLEGRNLPSGFVTFLRNSSETTTEAARGGHFRLPGLAAGKAEFLITADGYESREISVLVPEDGSEIRVDIPLTPLRNELRGRVVTKSGEPVGGAELALRREEPLGNGLALDAVTTSASDGSFHFESLARDRYNLTVRPLREVELEPAQFAILIDEPIKIVEIVLGESKATDV